MAHIAKVVGSRTVVFLVKCSFSSLLFHYTSSKFKGTCTYHMYMCVLIKIMFFYYLYDACTIVKCMLYGHCHSNHHSDGIFHLVGSLNKHSTSDH